MALAAGRGLRVPGEGRVLVVSTLERFRPEAGRLHGIGGDRLHSQALGGRSMPRLLRRADDATLNRTVVDRASVARTTCLKVGFLLVVTALEQVRLALSQHRVDGKRPNGDEEGSDAHHDLLRKEQYPCMLDVTTSIAPKNREAESAFATINEREMNKARKAIYIVPPSIIRFCC